MINSHKQKTFFSKKRLISFMMCLVMIIMSFPAQAKAEVKMLGSYSLKMGETGTLNMSSINETSTTWSSTDPSVATVSGSGLKGTVTPHKAGKTEIHIVCNTLGKTYGVYVTVKGSSKSSSKKSSGKKISLNKKNLVLKKGKTGKLKLQNAKASKVKWKSKSKKIATVSKKGVVKAKKKGKTKIVATYKKKKYTCKVTVNAAKTKVKITMTKLSKKKKTVTASPTKTVSVGNIKKDGYKVTIPKGAFPKNTKVKVTTSGKKVLLSVPGQKYVRLNEPVTIEFKLSKKVPDESIDYWKGVYFFGKQKKYMEPDISKLRKGILSFETVHFSPYSGEELSDKELRARAAYFDAVNSVSKDCQNDLMGSAIEEGMGKVVESLGFPKDSPDKAKILKALGKSTKFVELVRAGAEGDSNAFAGKTAELLTDIIIENADSTKVGYLGAAVSSLPDVLEKIEQDDYAGASTAVLKAVTSNIPYVKAVQFTASIVGTTINYYVDSETEDAYKAYYGMLKDGESGYSMRNGDGWAIIEQQMACPLRQMNDQAIKEYAAAKGVSTWSLSSEEQDQVRAMVKNNLITQFEYRYKHQTEIEQRKADTENFLKHAMKEGLLRRGDTSVAFDSNDDYMQRLTRLLNIRDNIRAMLGDKDFVDLEKTGAYFKTAADRSNYNNKIYAQLVALWIEKGWVKSKKGTEGRRAVAKYLAERYGVGVSIKPGATLSMKMNEKQTLSLKGSYGTVKWSSANEKVATVSDKGVVTPVKTGSVMITAFYGSRSYTCKVTITSGTPGVVEFPRVRTAYIREGSTSGDRSIELTGKDITNPAAVSWSVDGGASVENKGDYVLFKYTSTGTYNLTAVYNGVTYMMHISVSIEQQQPGGGWTVWPRILFDADRIE